MATKYELPKIEELLGAGVHFGHQTKRWHPDMEPYIYTVKRNIHIIDLEDTERLLKEACDFLYNVAKSGKKVIFVGTKKQAVEATEIEAKRSGALYVNERWLGGTLTNMSVIKNNNTEKLVELKRQKEAGELSMYTKKERLLIDREIERLERFVGGIVGLKNLPGAVFVIDSRREKTAIKEAKASKVPVVALVDTNCDPEDIDYIIPGNDDAIKSIAVILKALGNAVEAGYADYSKELEEGKKSDDTKKAKASSDKKESVKPAEPVKAKEVEKTKEKEEPVKEVKEPSKKKEADKSEKTKEKTKETPAKKKRGRPKKSSTEEKSK